MTPAENAPITDWDDAYANAPYIPAAETFPPRWEAAAAAFRTAMGERARLALPYGDGARAATDLFLPEETPRGLAVFVHGGYWQRFGREVWSHLAAGAVARGWAVAVPGYTLCPETTIPGIVQEIGAAIVHAAREVPGPVRLAGHSAGGHLVTRMLCEGAPLAPDIVARVDTALSISGVHDLRPLLATGLNDALGLDEDVAAAESPALLRPRPGVRLTCWVGGAERPEFRRQNALMANIWTGLGARTRAVEIPGLHHFDIIDGLARPEGPLVDAFLADGAFA